MLPNAVGLFENGVIRSTPAPELIYTMADPPNILGATQCLDMLGVMSLLQSGRVHLGFLGAAEVDRFGNLNSTEVQGANGLTRLPGSGGACDMHRRRTVLWSCSGIASGACGNAFIFNCRKWGWAGLAAAGGSAAEALGGVITKAVLRFGIDGEAFLSSTHPGVEIDDVLDGTGWKYPCPML